uniref:EF-hand domain-containing protein n=1 Tax=Cuerna arida TaxID=1464854 RepID=A0A1B6FQP4_9HEMI
MEASRENTSESSEGTEKLTIAFTESAPKSSSETSSFESTSSSESTSSYSSDTWTSQISMTSVYSMVEGMKRKEVTAGYMPVWRTMSLTEGTKMRTLEYFRLHSIYQLFSFLMSQLLVNAPPEPIPFLVSLLDRCLQYRDGDGSPPLLFENRHVQNLYTALDPLEDGFITYKQYLVGMNTLGLTKFEVWPVSKITLDTIVDKSTFIFEAEKALLNQLDRLLGKHLQKSTSQESAGGSTENSEKSDQDYGEQIDKDSRGLADLKEGGGNGYQEEQSL